MGVSRLTKASRSHTFFCKSRPRASSEVRIHPICHGMVEMGLITPNTGVTRFQKWSLSLVQGF